MRKTIPILIIVTALFLSCRQERKSSLTNNKKELEKTKSVLNTKNDINIDVFKQKNVDTKHVYVDPSGNNLIIENSYPRGGLKYTDPMGKTYVYAVFWSRISNETNNPFILNMEFSEDSYDLPASPGRFFKLYIPSDTLTIEKESLFNYGLDLEKYLDKNFRNKSDLTRTIIPKSTSGFYVLTLFNQGVNGTLRTGLSIKGQNLFYRINDKEIQCGYFNLEQLELQK